MRQLLELVMIMVLMEEDDAPETRGDFVYRERRSWYTSAKPMVEDVTFRLRFTEFADLADVLRPKLERDEKMGALRIGVIPVEFQLAMALRFLAGVSIFEVMDGNVIARSTAYAVVRRVIDAINQTRELDCVWPEGDGALDQCGMYRQRSTNGVIRMCVGAMDGLFVRLTQPSLRRHVNPRAFYSGHKKAFGMNFQGVCNARYESTAWTMNCPGSCNDRTAFKHSVSARSSTHCPSAATLSATLRTRPPIGSSCRTQGLPSRLAKTRTTSTSRRPEFQSNRPSESW
ncbi:unnamed protein product [Ectocarpus sp. 4 AP-2014]